MFGSFIGKVLSTPIKIANIPMRVADRAMNYALDENPRKRCLSAPLDEVSDVIQETAKEILDD